VFRVFLASCILWFVLSQQVYALEDPTRPPAAERIATVQRMVFPKLNSILLGRERKLAIIDGRVLQEGELGDGFQLIQIDANAVIVSIEGVSRRLTMGGDKFHKEFK
jgi:MSHA biogenesis protein MshK